MLPPHSGNSDAAVYNAYTVLVDCQQVSSGANIKVDRSYLSLNWNLKSKFSNGVLCQNGPVILSNFNTTTKYAFGLLTLAFFVFLLLFWANVQSTFVAKAGWCC